MRLVRIRNKEGNFFENFLGNMIILDKKFFKKIYQNLKIMAKTAFDDSPFESWTF